MFDLEDFEVPLKPLVEVNANGDIDVKDLNNPSVQKLVKEFILFSLNFGRMLSRKARTELEDYNMGMFCLSVICCLLIWFY